MKGKWEGIEQIEKEQVGNLIVCPLVHHPQHTDLHDFYTSQLEMAWLISAAKNRESTLIGSSWPLMNWHTPWRRRKKKITGNVRESPLSLDGLLRATQFQAPTSAPCVDNSVAFSYVLIWNGSPKFGQADHRVVGGLQVGERSAQEVLQTGHVRQGQVLRRGQRQCSGESKAEEGEQPEKPCRYESQRQSDSERSAK